MTAGPGGADAPGDVSWRANVLAAVVLCLLLVARLSSVGDTDKAGQFAFVIALFVLPLLSTVAGGRRLLIRFRWPVLGVQAVLTVLPFIVIGGNWEQGVSGLLAGMVLLTLPGRVSWPLAGLMCAGELVLRIAIHGLPWTPAWSAGLWVVIVFIDDCLTFFGLVRLADLVAQLQSARAQAAELAVAEERLRTAEDLQAAVGERLTEVAALTTAAQHALPSDPAAARARIEAAGVTAREAVARARTVTVDRHGPAAPGPAAVARGARVVPRLAWAILAVLLCGFGLQSINDVYLDHLSPLPATVIVLSIAAGIPLQLRHSRQVPGDPRLRAWPLTLAIQVALLYVPFAFRPLHFVGGLTGFAAGSCLLLLPSRWRWPGFVAVVVSWSVLWGTLPQAGPTTSALGIASLLYLTAAGVGIGLLVYGLSWLAGTARDLEALRTDLARMAGNAERLRVARDVHDLLGLGLSAIALKADLVVRLIGRDDARAAAEIAEMSRICAHARADIRLVTDASRRLTLDAELAAAREILASAGLTVRTDPGTGPRPTTADTVLAPVLREAVTNILRHSDATSCTIEVTTADGALRLRVSNDGAPGRGGAAGLAGRPAPAEGTGRGLANLTARLQATGGRLTVCHAAGRFELSAEIPAGAAEVSAAAPDPRPAGAPAPPAGSR